MWKARRRKACREYEAADCPLRRDGSPCPAARAASKIYPISGAKWMITEMRALLRW